MPNEARNVVGAAKAVPATSAGRALQWVDKTVEWIVILCMSTLVTIVSTQVVLRYVFNSSLDWAWEASRLAFVASIFLAMPLALREGSHVGIDILQQKLPRRARRYLVIVLNTMVVGLMLLVGVVGSQATTSTWDQTMSSLPVSTGWFYVPLLWCTFHSILHLLRQSVLLLRSVNPPGETNP